MTTFSLTSKLKLTILLLSLNNRAVLLSPRVLNQYSILYIRQYQLNTCNLVDKYLKRDQRGTGIMVDVVALKFLNVDGRCIYYSCNRLLGELGQISGWCTNSFFFCNLTTYCFLCGFCHQMKRSG